MNAVQPEGILGWIVIGLISLIGGVIGGMLSGTSQDPQKIVAIDVVKMVDQIRSVPGDRDQKVSETVSRARALAERLSEEGYIVLDGSMIIKAPQDTYVGLE